MPLRAFSRPGRLLHPHNGRFPTSDLVRAIATDVDDDDLVVLLADPDVLADVVIRHRVFTTLELNDRQDGAHATRDAEHRRERLGWQRVQPLPFLGLSDRLAAFGDGLLSPWPDAPLCRRSYGGRGSSTETRRFRSQCCR